MGNISVALRVGRSVFRNSHALEIRAILRAPFETRFADASVYSLPNCRFFGKGGYLVGVYCFVPGELMSAATWDPQVCSINMLRHGI